MDTDDETLLDSRPEHGPRLLFFSGGTALGPVATALTRFTHNAVHVITTFDSGGSSATLRQAFHMPAVGDVRARLMALADASVRGNPEMVALFAHRLPLLAPISALRAELESLAKGRHPLSCAVPEPLRQLVLHHLKAFLTLMPHDLDLSGASIGNLVLTAGYLTHAKQLEPVAVIFSKLVQALGVVQPVVNDDAHLCVELENGDCLIGQHRFTGKTASRISSPIRRMWLTRSLDDPAPITLRIRPRLAQRIRQADLICYPVGSFYSSVLANLLPLGVREAIHAAPCPKVFIPNLGTDPELFGLSVKAQVERISGESTERAQTTDYGALDVLLVDTDATRYPGGIPEYWLAQRGIRVYRAPLVLTPPFLDADRVCTALLDIEKTDRHRRACNTY